MNRPLVLLAATAIAASAIVAAPSAVAYNKDAYTSAAGRMLESKKIPKVLGTYRSDLNFYASASRPQIYLCNTATANISVPGAKYVFGANYENAVKKSPKNVSFNIYQFSSSKSAINVFRTVERQAKRCTGSQSDSSTDDDGVTYSWQANLQNGKVKEVSVVGVQSVFVNADYESGSSDQDQKYLSDTYTLYTLVNDAIIATTFTNANESALTPAERKGVHQLAFNAVTAWVE
jgi:hypothetical protein